MTQRILQFGTSRFLQAHADLFVHEARQAGQDIGPITIVKTTAGAERAGRVEAFGRPEGYPVVIRGYAKGKLVDETIDVHSIDRALIAQRDWQEVTDLFCNHVDIVISNVGDTGYDLLSDTETGALRGPAIPASYPGKLLRLLFERYTTGGRPLLVLPCELIANNGVVLRELLGRLAERWSAGAQFQGWLSHQVTICETLVDRIVSEALEPVGAIAEPYALWAIQQVPGMAFPFSHPSVILTDDLEPFLRLKLHILNLGHTYLARLWQSTNRRADETVREILADPEIRPQLTSLYRDEILKGFAARDMRCSAEVYVNETLERFGNPFLNHRIRDIVQNHAEKVRRRAGAFLAWVKERDADLQLPRLAALAVAYRAD